jgi:hypothetical protein
MAGYPVQRGHPPAITWEAARRRLRDSGTLSGTSAEEEQMTGKIMPLRERDTSTVQAAADAFLSSPRYVNRNTRRGYVGNPGHWQLATDSDSSPVALHAISADMYVCQVARRGGRPGDRKIVMSASG